MNSGITISISRKESDKQRCGYCLDGLYDEETWVCKACDTALHLECYEELKSCVTMGCKNKAVSSDEIQPRPIRRARRRRRPQRNNQPTVISKFASIILLAILMLLLIVLVPITCTLLMFTIGALISVAFAGSPAESVLAFFFCGVSTAVCAGLCYLLIKVFRKILRDMN